LLNQQQCFIYSTASFLSKLRAKKVENCVTRHKTNDGVPEISKMKYRNRIPERLFPVLLIVKKKKIMPTDRT
jgi:hypothetical protein